MLINVTRGKAIRITYAECVFLALVIQPCSVVTCGLSGCTYASTLNHKRQDLKKKLLNMKFVFEFSKMYFGFQVTYPLFVSDFNETWIFSTNFRKMHVYKISWKSPYWNRVIPCGRTSGRHKKKLIIAFRNFANAPKNFVNWYVCIT